MKFILMYILNILLLLVGLAGFVGSIMVGSLLGVISGGLAVLLSTYNIFYVIKEG